MNDRSAQSVVIIGASSDRTKFGNKAVRAYQQMGWRVIPVNPKATEIEGLPTVARLEDIKVPVERVLLYVPPQVGLTLLPAIANLKPQEVFVNPGTESPELLQAAEQFHLPIIQACAILDVGISPASLNG